MYKSPAAKEAKAITEELKGLRRQRLEAEDDGREEESETIQSQEGELEAKLESLRTTWDRDNSPIVSVDDIAELIAMWTGVPVMQIAQEESERLLHMEEELHKAIVGQEEAIEAISKAVRRARAGLKDPKRPIGSFIFLGPTGVGKTELTKALASFLFGSEEALVQLDMSEFMERHTVSRLVGAPPGYVGYEEGGQLTEAVRRRPYSVILLDEIEKAHPDVFNVLLQVLDDGRLTDGQGRTVDFSNSVLIMTSNLGGGADERTVMNVVRNHFKPEFLNRIDEIVVFHPLTQEHIREIVMFQVEHLRARLAERNLGLELTDAALDHLATVGYDPDYGARPLKRVIQKEIADSVALGLLKGDYSDGDVVVIDAANDGQLTFSRRQDVNA
jgi:ATP-dependent Clp protease ATP-binding subunit ClpA